MTMTKEELLKVALFMRRIEEDNTLQIKFEDLDTVYGMLYKGKNDNYLIVINSHLSIEKRIEVLWHESKHVCSNIMKCGDIEKIEKEAIDFSRDALKYSTEVLKECRSKW